MTGSESRCTNWSTFSSDSLRIKRLRVYPRTYVALLSACLRPFVVVNLCLTTEYVVTPSLRKENGGPNRDWISPRGESLATS